MTKIQLERQMNMLLKDLSNCDKRCRKISKAIGIEENELISYAMQQTKEILDYIESLKGEDK